jgi:uncharacterized protein YbgA (DUF1722 family)/uncharacterized protein YbbK (DUF523 family)
MIKVGISQCLLGMKVRYDGGHKRNLFCLNHLSKVFEFVPLCPEVGIGMGTPRPTIQLKGDVNAPRAVYSKDTGEDFTDDLKNYADLNKTSLANMSGYVFCAKSPSCGVERVKVYQESGHAEHNGMGIFAARVKQLFPLLPLEEDGRLNDGLLRDSFIKRVYIYNDWQKTTSDGFNVNALFKFHARHKMTLLAHCQKTYRELGPLISPVEPKTLQTISDEYISKLMTALKTPATRANNTNVLMHLQGYLKDHLESSDRQELAECIMEYRQGILPILSPLTLMQHHFKHHPDDYVSQQSYLNPYPKELAIRVTTKE